MKIIQTKKEMLALLRSIGAEEPLICVDELDLRRMFEKYGYAMLYELQCELPQLKHRLKFNLAWFQAKSKKAPEAVYFKVMSAMDLPKPLLDALLRSAQNFNGNIQCVFAYDIQPQIPEHQVSLTMLIA